MHEAAGELDRLAAEVPLAPEEWPAHDLATLASRIMQPVALIVGAADHLTQVAHVAALHDLLPDVVSWEVLPGEPHCPVGPAYPVALRRALHRAMQRER